MSEGIKESIKTQIRKFKGNYHSKMYRIIEKTIYLSGITMVDQEFVDAITSEIIDREYMADDIEAFSHYWLSERDGSFSFKDIETFLCP